MRSKSRPSLPGSTLTRGLLYLFVPLFILAGLFMAYAFSVYEEPPVDPAWALPGSKHIPAGAVTGDLLSRRFLSGRRRYVLVPPSRRLRRSRRRGLRPRR